MAMIGTYSEARLLKGVQSEVQKRLATSQILSDEAEVLVPRLSESEITVGRLLGKGGFCEVSDIKQIVLKNSQTKHLQIQEPGDLHEDFFQDRSYMAEQYIRDGKNYRYAFKTIQSSAEKDPAQFVSSVMDLVIESRYLAVLKHPNIIKMRAVSAASPYEEGRRAFVVIDKLYNILSDLLKNQWKERMPGAFKFLKSAKKKAQDFWIERLIAASDIASAIVYLHQNGIVYRDTKPHNVGVDVRGDFKLFDFGLAREMLPELENEDGTYRFTGGSGSLRYMAPEVAKCEGYNQAVDVHGFSILLWQMLSVETPFDIYITEDFFFKHIVNGTIRPKPDPKWPKEICNIMALGWAADWRKRPSIEDYSTLLNDVIYDATGAAPQTIVDISRRSHEARMGSRLPKSQ